MNRTLPVAFTHRTPRLSPVPRTRLAVLRTVCGSLALLALIPVLAAARDKPPAEKHAEILKAINEENRDFPFERETTVACPWVTHLQIHPAMGDIIAMGEGGGGMSRREGLKNIFGTQCLVRKELNPAAGNLPGHICAFRFV